VRQGRRSLIGLAVTLFNEDLRPWCGGAGDDGWDLGVLFSGVCFHREVWEDVGGEGEMERGKKESCIWPVRSCRERGRVRGWLLNYVERALL
jgi:hypothetical protein